MKLAIILGVLGAYFVLAVAIARFCAVNAGWERASDMIPPSEDPEETEPEPKSLGGAEADHPSETPGQGATTDP
jgi:hypothetical protein